MKEKAQNPLLQQNNRQSTSVMHENRFLRDKKEK